MVEIGNNNTLRREKQNEEFDKKRKFTSSRLHNCFVKVKEEREINSLRVDNYIDERDNGELDIPLSTETKEDLKENIVICGRYVTLTSRTTEEII